MRTKLEIVSGFLGAGKTSFINSYLETELCLEKEILIIVLEKGITNIRNSFTNIEIIYLEYSKDLKKTLISKINEKKYHKVIVEFNGTERLSLIGDLFKDKLIKKSFVFYGNYYIGDSSNLIIYLKNLGEIIIPFIQSSKLIVLNNLDLLKEDEKTKIIEEIEIVNQTSPIILSNSISNLSFDLKNSKYFKEDGILRKIKMLFDKQEGVR